MSVPGPLPAAVAAALRLVAHVEATTGSMAVVTGPVGSGKSFLLDVLEARALERGRRVLRVDAGGAASPERAARELMEGARAADLGARALVLVDRAECWSVEPCLAARAVSEALRGPAVVVASRRRATLTALVETTSTQRPFVEALGPLTVAEARALLRMHGVSEPLLPRLIEACGGNPLLLVHAAAAVVSRDAEVSVTDAVGEALLGFAVRWCPPDADPADALLLGALALVGDAPAEMLADAVGRDGESVRRALRKYPVVDETVRGLHLDDAPRRVYRAELTRHAPRAVASLAGRLRGYAVERLVAQPDGDRWVALLLRLEEADLAPRAPAEPIDLAWSGATAQAPAPAADAGEGWRRRFDWFDGSGELVGGLELLAPTGDAGAGPLWAAEVAAAARAGLQRGSGTVVRLVRAVLGGAAAGSPSGLSFRLAADLLGLVQEEPTDEQLVVLVGLSPDDPAGAALHRLLGGATALAAGEPARGAPTSSAWLLPPGGAVDLLRRTVPAARDRLPVAAVPAPAGPVAPADSPTAFPPVQGSPDRGPLTAARIVDAVAHSVDFEQILRARLLRLADDARLSVREREVLDLLLLGRSAGDIGIALDITARTAKFHQANVLAKLGADSRHDLMRLLL